MNKRSIKTQGSGSHNKPQGSQIQQGTHNLQSPFNKISRKVRIFGKPSSNQTKFQISRQNEKYEQEADQVANHIMKMKGMVGDISTNPALKTNQTPTQLLRGGHEEYPKTKSENQKGEHDKNEIIDPKVFPLTKKQIQHGKNEKTTPSKEKFAVKPPSLHKIQSPIYALHNSGRPLDSETRTFIESHFGFDFSQVRVHTDNESTSLAKSLNARAFTSGSHIGFTSGAYSPRTNWGMWLLSHELTHVVQQGLPKSTQTKGSTILPSVVASNNVLFRAVSSEYSKIEDNLTYGIFDWAITDEEALEVLEILSSLKPEDFKDTVRRMEVDGLVGRLLENISDSDKVSYASLIQKIQEERSTSAITAHIESLLSYGILDWAITDEEAHVALETFKSLMKTPKRLKEVIRIIAEKQFQRFFRELSSKDKEENKTFLEDLKALRATGMTRQNARDAFEAYKKLSSTERRKMFETDYPTGRIANMTKALSPSDAIYTYADELRELLQWVQKEETRKASGMTDEEMAEVQAKFMKAAREKTARKKIEKERETKGLPKELPPTRKLTPKELEESHREWVRKGSIETKEEKDIEWLKKKEAEKKKWEKWGAEVIDDIVKLANKKYPEVKITKDNFKADFKGIEKRGKHVYAMSDIGKSGKRVCIFGYDFVKTARANPEYVMITVVHEIFGHPEFGPYSKASYLLALYDAAAAKMKGYKKPPKGSKKRKEELDNFAYQGTEIYAELRSFPYLAKYTPEHIKKGVTVKYPKWEVSGNLRLIKKYWEPRLAIALVRGLYVRFSLDPRITSEALELFKKCIKEVFEENSEDILK